MTDQTLETIARFEGIALGVWILLFTLAELARPAVPWSDRTDRRRHRLVDGLALLLVGLFAGLGRQLYVRLFRPLEGDAAGLLASLHGLPLALRLALSLILLDLCLYAIHRAMHRIPCLWRLHDFHHSAEHVWWLSGFRTSLGHALLFGLPQVVVPFLIFGLEGEALAMAFAVGLVIQFWPHANLSVRLGPLERILITPDAHRIHHSLVREEQDANFGVLFSVWDQLLGTWIPPRQTEPEVFGLDESRPLVWMVLGLPSRVTPRDRSGESELSGTSSALATSNNEGG